jgi:YVTN family beta-propeller protein
MKTKSVVLLSTLATAALLLIAVFVLLAAFSLTAGLTLAAPPDAPGPASVAATVGLADGISTSTITATVEDELDTFSGGFPTLSASAVYTVEAESSEVTTVGTWSTYTETACSASNGQVIFSGNTNDKVSYTFTGTQVTVLYQKQWNTGFMDVLVDGLLRQQVDTYYGGGGKQCQQAVVVSNLPWGPHTVETVVVGDKNPSSSGNSIVVDAFTITTDISTGCEDAYEPDNDFTTAVNVTLPSFTSHNFDFAGDQDWVRFWGYEGITYTIETMNLAISGTQTADTELGLYWWDGSDLVELDTDKDSGSESRAALIVWPITTTDWYYVNIGRAEAEWSFSGCNATYDLSVTSTGPPCTTTLVIEPETLLIDNTATMTATVVDCSGSPLAGQVITFSTTSDLGSGGISPITATTNANGQAVSYISSTITGLKLVTATAPNLVAGTDTVTFIVPEGCEDDYEPDDSRAEATIVTPPNTTHHNFHDDGDVDWVGFWGTAGITYTIETLNLTTSPTTQVNTELYLYSWDGSALTWLDQHNDRHWPSDLSSVITWPVTTDGWYYVVAGRFTGTDYGCDAYYDLRISGPPAHVYLPIILKNHPPPPPTPIPSPPMPTPGPCYPLVEITIPVGNDPRGVAYNDDDDLIYVANYGDDTVSVINGVSYDVTKVITGVVGANGVAYDSDHGLVYVTNQSIDALTVISATTNTIVETIPVGDQPHGVAYNATSHKVYVANYGGNSVTIVDANTMTTTATISGLSEPAHVAANPVSNKVYVSNHGNGTVTVIRGSDDAVLATVSLGSSGPYGIAADTQRNLIYVVSISVLNLDAPNLVTIDGATDLVKSDQWGKVNIHKSDDSLVPLRVIAVHPELGPSAGGGHLYITSSSGDVAGDGSHGTDQMLMSRKGWPEGFNKPNPLDVGSRPEEGIAVDLANNRVFVTARDVNRLTVIKDTGDHSQLCSEAFALDGYVIEPVP